MKRARVPCLSQACAWTPTLAQTATHVPVGSVGHDSASYLPISTRPNPVTPYSWKAGELSVKTSHCVSARSGQKTAIRGSAGRAGRYCIRVGWHKPGLSPRLLPPRLVVSVELVKKIMLRFVLSIVTVQSAAYNVLVQSTNPRLSE